MGQFGDQCLLSEDVTGICFGDEKKPRNWETLFGFQSGQYQKGIRKKQIRKMRENKVKDQR